MECSVFYPGLVGGHCIGVDPYYFIYRAEQLGYHSQIILAGRKINDDMPFFVVDNIIKHLIKADKKIKGLKIVIFGITFKENCPDVRNSKVIDIIVGLREYEIEVIVVDPLADPEEVFEEYGITLANMDEVENVDCVVIAVAHDNFKNFSFDKIKRLHKDGIPILIDIKGIYNKEEAHSNGIIYWRL